MHLPAVAYDFLSLGVPVAVSAAVTALVGFILARVRHPLIPLDYPNGRSLHSVPVARMGGLAIGAGILAASLYHQSAGSVLAWAGVLFVLSFIDDHGSLPVLLRLIVQFICAAGVVAWLHPPVPLIVAALLVVAMVWGTNLFNFMDGSDGLATGTAAIVFGVYADTAWVAGDFSVAILAAIIAAAAMTFLAYNFPPARAFLGDTGAIPLGFLIAAVGLLGWDRQIWPLWFPPLVSAPFVADATVTLLRRIVRREPFWRAHRTHYYQRLVLMGWSHGRVAMIYYVLTIGCSAAAMLGRNGDAAAQTVAIASSVLLLAVFGLAVDARWAQHHIEFGRLTASRSDVERARPASSTSRAASSERYPPQRAVTRMREKS